MKDNAIFIDIGKFITDRTRQISGKNVITDVDTSELFETDLPSIHKLVDSNPELFPNEHFLELTEKESLEMKNARHAFTEQGLFNLAGLLKTKRAIKVYVCLVQVMVSRLQGNASRIVSSLH